MEKRTPVVVNPVIRHPLEHVLVLDGIWTVRLDETDIGDEQKWFLLMDMVPDRIMVPGSLQGQGYGSSDDTFVMDFNYNVKTYRTTYKSTAWYGRSFILEQKNSCERYYLNFGGVSPTAKVWINGIIAGENHNPFAPFGFDVTEAIVVGKNNIVVRVSEDDRLFAMGYNFMGTWSGLYRGVELRTVRKADIREIHIYPDIDKSEIKITADCVCTNNEKLVLKIRILEENTLTQLVHADYDILCNNTSEYKIKLEKYTPWSPDQPFLYRCEFILEDQYGVCDAISERFGFVNMKACGKNIMINDEPYYMRGTGDFFECPDTVSPDTDRNQWRKKLKTLRLYGYNYVRCQSYIPNPEYMDVADEVGLIVQSEMGMLGAICGSDVNHIYAWPQPNAENYRHIIEQWLIGVKRDINHPSSMMFNMSNELSANRNKTEYPNIAWKCYRETKKIKPNAMIIWTDGGINELLPSDYINAESSFDKETDRPVIQHEYRWWTSYPDIRTIGKYNGALRPFAVEMACRAAFSHGLGLHMVDFAEVSQELQFIEAKGKMERCRRDFPSLAGICHFNAMDTQPSPQGIIDIFYDKKRTSSQTWVQTNGDCVLLSSLEFDNRCFISGAEFNCTLFISDFAHPCIVTKELTWKIICDGNTLSQGVIKCTHQSYCTDKIGDISIQLPYIEKPVGAYLEATITDGKREIKNLWRIWIFPDRPIKQLPVRVQSHHMVEWLKKLDIDHIDNDFDSCELLITDYLDERCIEYIKNGGKIIFAVGDGLKRAFHPQGILDANGHYFFSNPACYPKYEDGQHGTLIKDDPLYGDFPHEKYADSQFFNMIAYSAPIDIEPLGLCDAEPIMRMIHTYQMARPLAEIVKRSYGKGIIILTSLDLDQTRIEARNLLWNMLDYLAHNDSCDITELADGTIEKLLYASEIAN